MYKRPQCNEIIKRLRQPRRFIQVIIGPRQVGKTTAIQMSLAEITGEWNFCACDDPGMHDRIWLESQWESARRKASQSGSCILAIDEIQKIPDWSELVKRLWDEDTAASRIVKVIICGSSSLLVQKGLSESLAGRYELMRLMHWSYAEMKNAFGWDVAQYIVLGGYPGAAPLADDVPRWRGYINDSLIEATVSKDILHMTRIDKPALLRRLFTLGCSYSGQIVSYQKLLGQLQDAGNTTTLARYLHILEQAGLLAGLQKFSGRIAHVRQSIPKLQVLNTGLMSAVYEVAPSEISRDPVLWGRFTESAIGAHLANQAADGTSRLFYWREQNREVDFVVQKGGKVAGIEVKSSRRETALPGLESFSTLYSVDKKLLVGSGGVPIEEFLQLTIEDIFAV